MRANHTTQTDLFGSASDVVATRDGRTEPMPEDFIEGIRTELRALLQRASSADRLPWPDYTLSALAEMRFDSLSNWLPEPEAVALRQAFAVELDRLYSAEQQ